MTQETPAKVFGLLGTAMASMFFLFAVTVTNANFSQTEKPFPDVFNPQNIVAVLDNVSHSYSEFLEENLIQPEVQSFAIMQYNVNYVIDEAAPDILAYTGLSSLAEVPQQSVEQPQVAGAFTQVSASDGSAPQHGGGFSIDSLYSLLIR